MGVREGQVWTMLVWFYVFLRVSHTHRQGLNERGSDRARERCSVREGLWWGRAMSLVVPGHVHHPPITGSQLRCAHRQHDQNRLH
eukprot:379012-Rhodomonas_salina.3